MKNFFNRCFFELSENEINENPGGFWFSVAVVLLLWSYAVTLLVLVPVFALSSPEWFLVNLTAASAAGVVSSLIGISYLSVKGGNEAL